VIDYFSYSEMLTVQVDMCFPFEYGFYRKIGVQNMRRIAEVGCGNGYFLNTLSKYFGDAKYYGYDHCGELIKLAQSDSNQIDFQVGSIDSLKREYDLLILRLIMHQLEDREAFIEKLSKTLSEKTQLVIIDPFDKKFQLTPKLPAFNEHLARHRDILSPNTAARNVKEFIEQEVGKFGFQLVEDNCYYIPSVLPGYKKKYYEYMLSTSRIIGCSQAVLKEIDSWYHDPNAYAQIGLFMTCFRKLQEKSKKC